jgi:predicted TIM-barrel fold metal-dependent hydrolase
VSVSDRVLIVSSDCHIDFPTERSKEYLESAYHGDFDHWIAAKAANTPRFLQGTMDRVSGSAPELSDPEGRYRYTAPVDAEVRLKGLEANGVAAEVVIPNPLTIPFTAGPGARNLPGFDARLPNAGNRAYNRWLAEFCDPDRQAGLAVIDYDDVDDAVAEIRRAASAGMRGAYLDGQLPGLPMLFDEHYEPIWTALEEEGLAATFHGGAGLAPDYYALASPVTMQLMFTEAHWFAHRPLWLMIWGGVLERHPELNVVFTEQGSDWVPGTLNYLDSSWAGIGARSRGLHDVCPRPPREYWNRQCYLGASLLSRAEIPLRHEIGVGCLMYGADFPHPEGHWGKTLEHLQALFGTCGVPEDETRRILGETAAGVYRFDTELLAPVVARCGLTINEILKPAPSELDPEVEANVGRAFKGW